MYIICIYILDIICIYIYCILHTASLHMSFGKLCIQQVKITYYIYMPYVSCGDFIRCMNSCVCFLKIMMCHASFAISGKLFHMLYHVEHVVSYHEVVVPCWNISYECAYIYTYIILYISVKRYIYIYSYIYIHDIHVYTLYVCILYIICVYIKY